MATPLSNASKSWPRIALLLALALPLAGCPEPNDPPIVNVDLDPAEAEPVERVEQVVEPKLLTPLGAVAVSPAFEAIPVIVSAKPGTVITALANGEPVAEGKIGSEQSDTVLRLDVPIYEEVKAIDVIADEGIKVASIPLEWFPAGRFSDIFAQEAPDGDGEGEAAEAGEGNDANDELSTIPREAVDLLRPNPNWNFWFPQLFVRVPDDHTPFIMPPPFFEWACLLDVDVHKSINQQVDEPLVPEGMDLSHGAFTLRNDDADWDIGPNPAGNAHRLPVTSLETDLDKTGNARENDLVRVDAHNPWGLKNVYLFGFTVETEANLNLNTEVKSAAGRKTRATELKTFDSHTKGSEVVAFLQPVPKGTKTFWVEGRRGGTYRFVIGILPPGATPQGISYDPQTKATTPQLFCDQQAQLTVPVVDIYQRARYQNRLTRQTAFDVYWGGRPHFTARVWPADGQYEWAPDYRIGANLEEVPGDAITGQTAHMLQETAGTHGEPREGRATSDDSRYLPQLTPPQGPANNRRRMRERGMHNVMASGPVTEVQNGKGIVYGGIAMEHEEQAVQLGTQQFQQPVIEANAANKYPHRVSLGYTITRNGIAETLVRPEPLALILPRIHNQAAIGAVTRRSLFFTEGQYRQRERVASRISYEIGDTMGRKITARTIPEYLFFYGAGLKAWEALGANGQAVEGAAGASADTMTVMSPGAGLAVSPVGTAQRDQARVHPNRMIDGEFFDTLIWEDAPTQLAGANFWRAWNGLGLPASTVWMPPPAWLGPALFEIPQDVILQLRTDRDRYDLMAFQGNTLSLFIPSQLNKQNSQRRRAIYRWHLRFTPGAQPAVPNGAPVVRVPVTHRR